MQLGTLSGNPVASAAGLRTLEILAREGAYDRLQGLGRRLQQMQSRALEAAGIAHQVVGDPALFDIVFLDRDVTQYRDVQSADLQRGALYNTVLREQGIFKSPGKLYPSLALGEDDLDRTEAAIMKAVAEIA